MEKNITIGWIGTGVMGTSMVGHLHRAGYKCIVYNRTKAKAEKLIANGVSWANSPGEVAAASDVVFTIVGFPKDVHEVYFGENGILNSAKPGAVLVDMTTTEPSLSVEIYVAAKTKNIQSIDAPVSGGDVGAQNATLSIMVGGEKEAVEQIRPLFELLGKSIVYQGPAGSGQHTKMCNQITIAGTMIGVCESLLYGHKAGLDLPTMLSSISGGAAGCWTLNNLAPRIVARNFDPGFFVEHFIKDMGIALKEAESMGLSLPGLALVKQLYLSVQAQGHGKLGTHALTLALEKMSGL
ncbi:NAD(P)-dependent oxidoreductase [Prolixibacteraceae bacterium Z1-6]|uniref:NAD(P)-dependent oxidoreductase n=1 Tax=Draconibacterium aestuarii TaxID=2998507 RepID=A0A9X3FBM4_9BACT|nr:NAD(P)-dependent oxidoreductase [Prolixibacteraceae bacterium Z1-6]